MYEDSKFIFKVDFIVILTDFDKDLFFEELHCSLHYAGWPGGVFVLLIEIYFFDELKIFLFNLLEKLLVEFVFIFVEFNNRSFHSSHQRFSPTDYSSDRGLSTTDHKSDFSVFIACFSLNKKLSIYYQLFSVTFEHISVFLLQSLGYFWQSINILEIVQ